MSAASDIPAYGRQKPVPWNTESGVNLAPGREAVELAWSTDIISDPADTNGISDPASGYSTVAPRTTEI